MRVRACLRERERETLGERERERRREKTTCFLMSPNMWGGLKAGELADSQLANSPAKRRVGQFSEPAKATSLATCKQILL